MDLNDTLQLFIADLSGLRKDVDTFALFDEISLVTTQRVRTALEQKTSSAKEVDLILYSGGGSADDAYRIIKAFYSKYETVNIIVPSMAKSAATLLALGGTKIVFHEYGEFGPLDAQVSVDDESHPGDDYEPALNSMSGLSAIERDAADNFENLFLRFLHDPRRGKRSHLRLGRKTLVEMLLDYNAKFYAPAIAKIDSKDLGAMERSLQIAHLYAYKMLEMGAGKALPQAQLDGLVQGLVYSFPDHGFVIDFDTISGFLPNTVVKSSSSPYSGQYHKKLGELSNLFTTCLIQSGMVTGFVALVECSKSTEDELDLTKPEEKASDQSKEYEPKAK